MTAATTRPMLVSSQNPARVSTCLRHSTRTSRARPTAVLGRGPAMRGNVVEGAGEAGGAGATGDVAAAVVVALTPPPPRERRRALYASWRERAETAEREQASRVAEARTTERARIAREMHDVLAHRISLVAMHSGALAYRSDLSPQESAQAAAVIRDNAHLALTELRDVLGVLRLPEEPGGPEEGGPDRPQPTLADVDELLDEARAAGFGVDAAIDSDPDHKMPDTLSRNAFRIVQEIVTNARKHAPTVRLNLAVRSRLGDGITITARNGIPAVGAHNALPRSGMGLAGLTERAVLSGGTLSFGVDRRGEFVVSAQLPWVA